ncbi:hypothetical protein SBOR_5654 [Sclerotinia borealis F-4128]|uniref:Uncharacterized protein n=1 Tax=Sclerotinia borealis (strain F-4128) TaxID=1432307 RepID=W9CDL0_SCLBF|nr:hypothetical protein SBOR_5654 [Sclerotinia borealis F-4128]
MVSKPKRESDGDLPRLKSKVRRTDLDHEEGSSGVTDQYDRKSLKRDGNEKREKKNERQSEPARVHVRNMEELVEDEDEDENEKDPEREESNEFLELDNLEKKKKKSAEKAKALFMERFVGVVGRDAEGVKKLADKLEKEASIQNKEFLDGFETAYAWSGPFRVKKKNAKHDDDVHDFALMHQKGQDIIARASRVASQYNELVEKNVANELDGLLRNEWAKEDEQIVRMLELGKMVGFNKFESILNATKWDALDIDAVEVSKKFFPVVDEGKAIGWGKEAKKHERANRKLLKAFEE